MSRLDNFDEILKSYEGRKYKEELEIHGIMIGVFKAALCKGNHEFDYGVGFLIGKSDDARAEITCVFVPDQIRGALDTIVGDWKKAALEAKEKGDLIGMVFYTGKSEPFVRDDLLKIHQLFCDRYGMKNFWLAINSKSEIRYALNGEHK